MKSMKKTVIIIVSLLLASVLLVIFAMSKRHEYVKAGEISQTDLTKIEKNLSEIMGEPCQLSKLDRIEYGGQLSSYIYYFYMDCSTPHTELPHDPDGFTLAYYEDGDQTVLRMPKEDFQNFQYEYAADLVALSEILNHYYKEP